MAEKACRSPGSPQRIEKVDEILAARKGWGPMGMPIARRGTVAHDLERVFDQGTAAGLPEGLFLRRFTVERDEAAFSTLVSRRGLMVLGVCRRVLGGLADADDASQATFLVLLRRASSLQHVDSLGPWLYGVAWRVASRARAGKARRSIEEGNAAMGPPGIDWALDHPERVAGLVLLNYSRA